MRGAPEPRVGRLPSLGAAGAQARVTVEREHSLTAMRAGSQNACSNFDSPAVRHGPNVVRCTEVAETVTPT